MTPTRRALFAAPLLALPARLLPQRAALRPEAFGAKGDGATDDTAAFQAMARAVEAAGGGVVALRPRATYRLGRQVRGDGAGPAYMNQPMFSVADVRGLAIEGNGATLRLNDGLRYGSFHPATGARFDPPPGKFTDPRYAAAVGSLLLIQRARGVRISGLTLDGNMDRLVVGGRWNVDIQLHADGLRLLDVSDVEVADVAARGNGLDGVYVRGRGRASPDAPADRIAFTRVRCEGNGRQGVSVVGGAGLRFADCVFADTGQGAISSAPGAGVDVEPNGRDWASDITFAGCTFRNNRQVGLVAAEGASRGIVARGCTFWQGFAPGPRSRGSGDAFWLTKGAAVVEGCQVHGNVTNLHPEAVVRNCRFDDAALPGHGRAAQRRKYLVADARGSFVDCSFTVTAPGARALAYATKPVLFRRCRFHHAGEALPGNLAAAFFGAAATLEDVRFTEALRRPAPGGNYIHDGKPTLRGSVTVGGPSIRWGGKRGPVGDVARPPR